MVSEESPRVLTGSLSGPPCPAECEALTWHMYSNSCARGRAGAEVRRGPWFGQRPAQSSQGLARGPGGDQASPRAAQSSGSMTARPVGQMCQWLLRQGSVGQALLPPQNCQPFSAVPHLGAAWCRGEFHRAPGRERGSSSRVQPPGPRSPHHSSFPTGLIIV